MGLRPQNFRLGGYSPPPPPLTAPYSAAYKISQVITLGELYSTCTADSAEIMKVLTMAHMYAIGRTRALFSGKSF